MLSQIKTLFQKKRKENTSLEKSTDVATRIIKEENHRKTQIPVYPGLERYEMIEKIGDGAFSNVYKALDKETNKKVAIKAVRKHELTASEHGKSHLHPNMKKKTKVTERANILKEVQIMRTLQHENIVDLIQFSESDDYYYIVLELCEGGELFHQIVKLTYFSEDLARHVIVQVAQGIRYLHEVCGVVHRDIKPENILFDPIPIQRSSKPYNPFHDEDKEDEGVFEKGLGGGGIGRIKLADFGLSKVIWDSSTLTPCGTVGYTAPEIVRDKKYSKSVDMWAIGCVLYTILCGFPPFYDESIRALTEKVARGQYTFLSPWWDPISDSAKDLISHLLCVDPDDRYTIDQFFEHPWVTESVFVKKDAASTRGPLHVKPKTHPLDARALAMQNAANKVQQHYQPLHSSLGMSQGVSQGIPHGMSQGIPQGIPQGVAYPIQERAQGVESTTRRKDLFSPGVASIKEILDITYAVQRMGESKTRRANASVMAQGAGFMGGYDSISEDEEDEEDEQDKEKEKESRKEEASVSQHKAIAETLAKKGHGLIPTGPSASTVKEVPAATVKRRHKNAFQLDLSKATLLKNRGAFHQTVPPVST
ncbi:kinase-like domain-containing protein [Spinellus fusiger]|nr:kinase-like domain-containing protein [Spinellus fusiger]